MLVVAAVVAIIPLAVVLPSPVRLSLYLLGLIFGVVYQRSRICFCAAVRDPFAFRQTRSARAVILMIAVGSAGFLLLRSFLGEGRITGIVYPVGLHTVIGAFLFGVGMVLAGSCVVGSVVQSGQGAVTTWVALVGVYAGFRFGVYQLPWSLNFRLAGLSCSLLDTFGTAGVVTHFVALALLYIWMMRLERSLRA